MGDRGLQDGSDGVRLPHLEVGKELLPPGPDQPFHLHLGLEPHGLGHEDLEVPVGGGPEVVPDPEGVGARDPDDQGSRGPAIVDPLVVGVDPAEGHRDGHVGLTPPDHGSLSEARE